MRHFPFVSLSVLLLCGCGATRQPTAAEPEAVPVPAPVVVAVPVVAVTYGPSHWLSTAGWKSGAAEHGNPTKITVPPAAADAAARVVEVSFTGGTKDKAFIVHPVTKEDTAPRPTLSFSVLNLGDQPVQVAIAIKTGKAWVYHESAAKAIPPMNKEPVVLTFDLEAAVYKTAATKWQPTSTIADLGELREVNVVILNGAMSGQVTVVDAQIRERQVSP